jgi:hypothetical protein
MPSYKIGGRRRKRQGRSRKGGDKDVVCNGETVRFTDEEYANTLSFGALSRLTGKKV